MKILLIVLLMGGCSTLNRAPEISETSKEVPEWVYAPYAECSEAQEFCASGEAKTKTASDAQAKANLASIFEVKIQSELNVNTSSTQSFPWQGEARQEVQHSLQENVEQVLETVQVKKNFKKDGLTYSLASLDRMKASELIAGRLDMLDKELEQLWQRRQRTNIRKIFTLNLERQKLNERYSLVSGHPRPPRVKYEDVLAWKDSRTVNVPLALKIGQAPDWLSEKLKELLTEAGFKITKGHDQVVLLNVDSIKEYLNVEGFEKYTFTMKLTNSQVGEEQKVITASQTVTGRSQADALLKVRAYFTHYLEQHLSDLHLD